MTIQEIDREYNRTLGSLDDKRLKNALTSLQGMIGGLHAYTLQERLLEMQETYRYMLRYRMEGIQDPMREQFYHSLLVSAYEMADSIRHEGLKDLSPLAFYSKRRTLLASSPKSYANLHAELAVPDQTVEDKQLAETALATLFQRIWLSNPLTTDEALDIKEILYDDTLPFTVGSQIISALWMSLQMSFDKEKLFLLFDALYLTEEEIRIRSLVCMLLTLYVYRKRTYLYPQIADRLAAVHESFPGLTQAVRTIILRFILSRETEKITRRLQEEIIPEMIKLSPKFNKKINFKDSLTEQLGEDMNPEWQDMLAGSQLEKKMEEFSELQQEGADVMHSTFVHLKSFPFFREVSNWFLPFIPTHSSFGTRYAEDTREKQMLDTITMASFMCDSDKYSLYLSIMQLPEAHRSMMMNQFTGQAAEMIEQSKQELISKRDKTEIIIGQYIQDLYRFYKLFPSRLDFDDIFAKPLDFHNLSILQPYISDDESTKIIAEYFLIKNYYADALPLYHKLQVNDPENDVLYQKTGYCKQMLGDLKAALADYLHADLLHPESKWVIRRLAACYRSLKQPEEALRYYYRYEALEPDNLSTQLNIGHCLLEQKEYNEALKYYFKVDYLDTKGNKAWRPIAWTSFLTGKFEQARNYYQKITNHQPALQDYLNAGHTEWAMQNIRGALAFYKKAIESETEGFEKFMEQLNQDVPELIAAGIKEEEIPLMTDQLMYFLEDSL